MTFLNAETPFTLTNSSLVIAIDGHSSCGKSTMAKAMAQALEYRYIDTGAMYRALTYYMLQNEVTPFNREAICSALPNIHIEFVYNVAKGGSDVYLNGENVEEPIRTMHVSKNVSHYAAITEVRKALVAQQQQMGGKGRVVLDGRDIGTVVFPNAGLKIFMTASTDVRAQRRYDELKGKGQPVTLEEIRQNLLERDEIDSTREEGPLKKADDARVLDNTDLTMNEQLEIALSWANSLQQAV